MTDKRKRHGKLERHRPRSTHTSSLRFNFSWTLLGNVVLQLCMWGIISSYNKLSPTAAAAGLYTAGLLIMQPLFHFTDFNLRQIFVTDVADRWAFRDYLGHRIICSSFGIVCGTVIALFVFPGNTQVIAVTFWMGLAIAGQSLSELYHAFFQKHERFDLIARSLMLRGVLCLVGVCAAFYATQSVLISVVVMAALRFLTVFAYDLPTARRIARGEHVALSPQNATEKQSPRFSRETIVAMTCLGLPLAVNMGLLSLVPQIPRFWIERSSGLDALGQFASIAMLMSVGLMILNSLGVAMSQRFAQSYAAGDRREFVRLTLILVGGMFAVGCVGLLIIPFAGGLLLTIAYTKEYAPLADLFWLIMFGATFGFIGNALGYPVTAARRFRIQPVICIVQAVVTMIGCAVLVPQGGMFGAAWAVCIGNIVHAILFVGVWLAAYRAMPNSASMT